MSRVSIKNPILPGFNPDPNILRVNDTYYIVVSSFEWLPGIRVYRSNDLVNWEHETDILTNQVDLKGNPPNGSIWAPQISYADGVYYVVYTDVKSTKRPFKDSHNYLITSPSINGPWSKPVYLNSSGFDPSLFHDQDGRKWLLNEIWDYRIPTGNRSAGIVMQEFDSHTNKLVGQVYKIFDGTELAKTEAPHLYQHGDYYYLITAEGGTGSGHSVTICRSKHITGPYEVDPKYPMLTASDKPDSPLQCAGHGSIVQTPIGNWYMVYLCTRPLEKTAAILGRETAIQEVYWDEEGWLRLVDGGNGPSLWTEIVTETFVQQRKDTNFIDNFDGELRKEWNTLRIVANDSWCDLKSRKGYLRLYAGESIQSLFEHHLLAVRQKDFQFEAITKLDYHPKTYNQMAGLMLYLNDSNYLYMYVTNDEQHGRVIRFMQCEKSEFHLSPIMLPVPKGEIELKIIGDKATGKFYYRTEDETTWHEVEYTQNLLFLSGGFTGNFIGIVVHDMDKKEGSYADFNYFQYVGLDKLD